MLPVVVLLAVVGGAAYFGYQYWTGREQAAPVALETASPRLAPRGEPTPDIKYPVPAPPAESSASNGQGQPGANSAIPTLDESDQSLESMISNLFGPKSLGLFHLDEAIRRIVITIDAAATTSQASDESSFLRPLETEFVVAGKEGAQTISPKNYPRYVAYLDLLKDVDVQKLVSFYVRFYPLFQSAYDELGTKKYFNDRVIEVIDLALQTPEQSAPVEVAKPAKKYRYKFVDESLENMPAVQKALVRMGPENARDVKAKLRLIRKQLVGLKSR